MPTVQKDTMAHPDSESVVGKTPHLQFLDGIRGVAASMVVVHHLPVFVAVPAFLGLIAAPNPWVAIFITLSGFCLYLPAAGRRQVEMPRPFWEFMRRRARRIVPAWYASLVLCVLIGGFFTVVNSPYAGIFVPANLADILVHLSLTHSMTIYSGHINGPGYTLGTEFQLYVLMIGLIFVAARAGWPTLLAGTVLLCWVPGVAGKVVHHLYSTTFGLPFVIGMIAARLSRRPPALLANHSGIERLLLVGLGLLGVAAFSVLFRADTVINPDQQEWHFLYDYSSWAAALATGCACIWMARHPHCLAARLLSSRGAKALGSYSYSLYLTHLPLLALAAYLASTLTLSASAAFWVVFLPALAIIFGFAYLFSLFFERPFLNSKPSAGSAPPVRLRLPADADTAGVQ